MYKPALKSQEQLVSLAGQEFVTDQDPFERRVHLTILRNFDYETEFGPSYGSRLNRYNIAVRQFKSGYIKKSPDPQVLQLLQYRPTDPFYQYSSVAQYLYETHYIDAVRDFKRKYQDQRELEKAAKYFKVQAEKTRDAKSATPQQRH